MSRCAACDKRVRGTRKSCSSSCRLAAVHMAFTRECAWCGKSIVQSRVTYDGRHVCGQNCAYAVANAVQQDGRLWTIRPDGCWEFLGDEYQLHWQGLAFPPQNVIFAAVRHESPSESPIFRTCGNPRCICPHHLTTDSIHRLSDGTTYHRHV